MRRALRFYVIVLYRHQRGDHEERSDHMRQEKCWGGGVGFRHPKNQSRESFETRAAQVCACLFGSKLADRDKQPQRSAFSIILSGISQAENREDIHFLPYHFNKRNNAKKCVYFYVTILCSLKIKTLFLILHKHSHRRRQVSLLGYISIKVKVKKMKWNEEECAVWSTKASPNWVIPIRSCQACDRNTPQNTRNNTPASACQQLSCRKCTSCWK